MFERGTVVMVDFVQSRGLKEYEFKEVSNMDQSLWTTNVEDG